MGDFLDGETLLAHRVPSRKDVFRVNNDLLGKNDGGTDAGELQSMPTGLWRWHL
jgi:hypothetical protein